MIKKTIFLFLILSSLSIYSQITKGNWMVGGTAFIGNNRSESGGSTTNSFGFGINPNIGYFVIDKLALGSRIQTSWGNQDNGTTNSNYGINPFVRYYFLRPEKKINLFSDLSYGYSLSFNEGNKTGEGTILNFGTGACLFFNSSVALELIANYNNTNPKSGNSDDEFRLTVGLQIFLEKK